jgi:hypothetical protein
LLLPILERVAITFIKLPSREVLQAASSVVGDLRRSIKSGLQHGANKKAKDEHLGQSEGLMRSKNAFR